MSTKTQAAQVTLPSEREVEVTRSFRAARALVYEAYRILRPATSAAAWATDRRA